MKTELNELFRLAMKPGEKVGLQSLIDALELAKDGVITGTVFLKNKVKYNIEVSGGTKEGVFRLANVEPYFIHPPIENEFHYNSKTAIEARRQAKELSESKDSPFNHGGWNNYDETPEGNFPDGYSFDVLIDLNGNRKDFRVGWYDFDKKEWMFHVSDVSALEIEHLKWTYLPLG